MRSVRLQRVFGYGVSLALSLTLAAPGVPRDLDGHLAFAQNTDQPGAGQAPTPSPEPVTGPPAGSGQQPGVLVPVSAAFVPDMGGPQAGFGEAFIDEGGDVGEGLSNQRVDPDD